MEQIFTPRPGVLIKPPSILASRVGAETNIVYEDVLKGRSWTSFLRKNLDEMQRAMYFDTSSCTDFSSAVSLAQQGNRLVIDNVLPTNSVSALQQLGIIDSEGTWNLSDRYNAWAAGTTEEGNYMEVVADAWRNKGILAEKDWSFPYQQKSPVLLWKDWITAPPKEIQDKAKEAYKYVEVRYEWVLGDGGTIMTPERREILRKHQQQAPLQLAVPTCRWSREPIRCDVTRSQHAITLQEVQSDNRFSIHDQYPAYVNDNDYTAFTYLKTLSADYCIPWAMKLVLLPRLPVLEIKKIHYPFKTYLKYGQTSAQVAILQDILKERGHMPKRIISTGYFGDLTKEANRKLQIELGVNPLSPENVGPQTTKKLNQLYP